MMDDRILGLVRSTNLSISEAVDYVAVEKYGYSQTGWAVDRGVTQQSVSRNVANARSKLSE